jgi:hypothetical protein
MKLRIVAGAALVLAAPASAAEMRYGWCEIDGGPAGSNLSGLLQQPKGSSDEPYERAFAAGTGLNPNNGHRCWFYYSSPSEAKSYFERRQRVIQEEEKKTVGLTGWTGPYGVASEPGEKASGPYLTVESDVGASDDRRTQEDRELQAQRDGAAALAKRVSDTARADAKIKAQLAKFFEELKKRGSAQ